MDVRQFSERNSTITSEPPSSRITSIIGDNYDGSSSSLLSSMTADPYEASEHDLDVIDDDDEEYDRFDLEGIPMPRQSSSSISRSSIPIEIIQPSRQGRYESEDPLFQGVCLYHTSTSAGGNITTTTTKESNNNNKRRPSSSSSSSSSHHLAFSWFFPSIFKHLLYMQQQR